MPKLFSPVKLGSLELAHRVVHAPMTRMRSEDGDVPGDLMIEYYSQRTTPGGLLISEGPAVGVSGRVYYRSPGIWSDEQTAGWKRVSDAIHAKGGLFFTQLWHGGRMAHVDLTDGAAPLAPSVVPFEGVAVTPNGVFQASPARELAIDEIAGLVALFRKGAENAKAAGVDGVEIHAANGYLIDQFLLDGANKRSDAYGGAIENRARLLLEIVAAVVDVWGDDRVAVRLSPSGKHGDVYDSDPQATFGYVAEQLNRFKLAYLHVIEPRIVGDHDDEDPNVQAPVAAAFLRKIFTGPIIAAGGFVGNTAERILERGDADAVAFGRYFTSNPDLVKRLRLDLPLNKYNRETFYGGDRRGYSDLPFLEDESDAATYSSARVG
ncbi:N-ethylmaleimide reductase [Nitrobacteraceae bacterium AZCC 2161]